MRTFINRVSGLQTTQSRPQAINKWLVPVVNFETQNFHSSAEHFVIEIIIFLIPLLTVIRDQFVSWMILLVKWLINYILKWLIIV